MSNPAPPVPASIALLAREEFEDRPFALNTGAMLPMPTIEAKPPAPQAFVIPVWSQEEREREAVALATTEPAPPPMTAVESLFARAGELGEVDFPEREFGSPLVLGPLERPTFPEPSWHEEEAAAAAENKRFQLEHAKQLLAAEELPRRHPPPRRGAA